MLTIASASCYSRINHKAIYTCLFKKSQIHSTGSIFLLHKDFIVEKQKGKNIQKLQCIDMNS